MKGPQTREPSKARRFGMSTLSLDLRGVEATHALPSEARAEGASMSLLLHGVGITSLVLIPLLQSTNPPEVSHAILAPLARPITVTLPPARVPARRAPAHPASAVRSTAPVFTPALTPDSPNRTNLLDVDPVPGTTGEIGDLDPSRTEGVGDDCPLGSICGPAIHPIAPAHPPTVRIGGLIKEPRLIDGRAPVYPAMAQAAGVGGKVVLEAHVGPDGRVRGVTIVAGHSLFDEAALASVRSRRYEPLLLNDVPTDFLITITVVFNVRR
jgi:protein TonB